MVLYRTVSALLMVITGLCIAGYETPLLTTGL